MFTGIIAALGHIERASGGAGGTDAGVQLVIDCKDLPLERVALGDSIAVNGVCLTVTRKHGSHIEADVSAETLRRTVGLDQAGWVNLEPALSLGDALGGHLVSGHVDGVGRVLAFEPRGESYLLQILAPSELGRFFAYKGSVTVNGVSLTVNHVEDRGEGCAISINLIPHTLRATTLNALREGSLVNLEIDMIARYIERLHSLGAAPTPHPSAS